MGTFDKETADQIRCGAFKKEKWVKIVEYTSAWGTTCYGCIRQGQDLDMYKETAYVINPRVYWEKSWEDA
jgi:hypothetical protein